MKAASGNEFAPIEVRADDRVLVLTGAGVSAESGIPTFRDANGLWHQYRFEEVASPEAWARDPGLVWRFYSERRAGAAPCRPNPGHEALARLEESIGDRFFLCTQNVDSLHEMAGSRRVHHMHGELYRTRCEDPRCALAPFEDHEVYVDTVPRCPRCGAQLRPHICWFGEMPFGLGEIGAAMETCTLFLAVGSSGVVYPAAGFAYALRQRSNPPRRIYIGPELPANADDFDECRLGKAGELLPAMLR